MDYKKFVSAILMQIPALGLGFVFGMIFMRGNYMRIIKRMQTQIERLQRKLLETVRPYQ